MKKLSKVKKITLATFKGFVNRNRENLMIRCESSFSGMSDMVERNDNASFTKAVPCGRMPEKNTLGVRGIWLVARNSRDYFYTFESATMVGISVINACGSFVVAVNK